MFNNPYEAPQELATGGHVTKELNSVTVHFDDIHYSLSVVNSMADITILWPYEISN